MNVRHPTPWLRLLVLLAWAGASCPAAATHAGEPAVPRRLEIATGVRDGVIPVAITAERSRWQPVGGAGTEAGDDIATPDVIRWGSCPPWPAGPMVLLHDGGVIAGRIVAADERTVVVLSASLGRLELPAEAVRGYRASLAIGPATLARAPDRNDRHQALLLANGDRVAARSLTWAADSVSVEPVGRRSHAAAPSPVPIPADVVRAVDFAPSNAQPPRATRQPRILAATMDGSRFAIATLEPAPPIADAPRVRLVVRLPERDMTAHCDADEVVAIAVDGGLATFLAARPPAAYEQSGEFGPHWPLGQGHAVSGEWPAVRGTTGFTALGIHASARVRYRLDGPATRFESLVAIDDTAGSGGSVVVRVLAGRGEETPREVFSSPVLRGGDDPLSIRVDLPATTDLEIVVDAADGDAILDRTLWLDPLVVGDPQSLPVRPHGG